jgi:signal peptidase I
VAAVLVAGGTALFGLSFGHVKGASMSPYLAEGDALVLQRVAPSSLREGDVVLLRLDGHPVLHRVVGIARAEDGGLSVITRGDANPAPDTPVPIGAVEARLVFAVPYLGGVTVAVLRAWRAGLPLSLAALGAIVNASRLGGGGRQAAGGA